MVSNSAIKLTLLFLLGFSFFILVNIHDLMQKSIDREKTLPNYEALVENQRKIIQRYEREINELKAKLQKSQQEKYKVSEQIFQNARPSLEYDLYPFSAFFIDRIFPAEPGIFKRNVEKLNAYRQIELNLTIHIALNYLNERQKTFDGKLSYLGKFSEKDFRIGFYRVTPYKGYEYELHFMHHNICCTVIRIQRPLTDMTITSSSFITEKENEKIPYNIIENIQKNSLNVFKIKPINFILPLWGNRSTNAFQIFMKMYEAIVIDKEKGENTLSIVHVYNDADATELEFKKVVENLVKDITERKNYSKIKIIHHISAKPSRAKALSIGAQNCCNGNPDDDLMFFCDVDVIFTMEFLNLCRANTEPGVRVFYPITYSLYNPSIVNKFDKSIHHKKPTLIIKKDSGYWRDIGYGMTCQHKVDFMNVNGFNDAINIEGWGDEDIKLFRSHLKSKIEVVRSIVPGLFHIYHEKKCDQAQLSSIQYKHCLDSKILSEASQRIFGFMHFNFTPPE